MNIEKNKLSEFFYILLFFTFFCHGVAYFFYGDIYDKSNPIKLIKYIILGIIVLCSYFHLIFSKKIKGFNVVLFNYFLIMTTISLVVFYKILEIDIFLVLFFLLPIFSIFTPVLIKYESLLRVLIVTLYFAFLFFILEYFFFRSISLRFNVTGFRAISIFINPNALGCMAVLIISLILRSKHSLFLKISCFSFSLILVFFSGSKTAMIGIIFIVLYQIISSYRTFILNKKVLSIVFIIFSSLIVLELLNVDSNLSFNDAGTEYRSMSVGSGYARIEQFDNLIHAFSECPLLPLTCDSSLYIDNGLIVSWVYLGLFGFLIICFIIIFAILKSIDSQFILFFLAFLLMLQTTNLLSIWPSAYLFWMIFGYTTRWFQDE